ncbi:MAG: polysaccharide deacetylase family protein [Bacillota bacterium]|nr:polysaccharide deacetylase family protein [Bacillota bacterium]
MRKWKEGVLLLGLAVGLTAAVATVADSVLPASAEAGRLIPVYSVDTEEKKVAISFDAAWGNQHTGPILDILDQYGVKTTFFLVDFWAEEFPEDVKEIAARGHEIGNHSSSHPDMTQLTKEEIKAELTACGTRILELTGVQPTLFRPPFGSYNNTLIETCRECGYEVIQWSVDSLDWKDVTAEQVVERVIRSTEKGSIVLFHNNAEQVEAYLPLVLEGLQSQGFQVVPVGELIHKDNYRIDHTGKQIAEEGVSGNGV